MMFGHIHRPGCSHAMSPIYSCMLVRVLGHLVMLIHHHATANTIII
jgi:hypothetical protein